MVRWVTLTSYSSNQDPLFCLVEVVDVFCWLFPTFWLLKLSQRSHCWRSLPVWCVWSCRCRLIGRVDNCTVWKNLQGYEKILCINNQTRPTRTKLYEQCGQCAVRSEVQVCLETNLPKKFQGPALREGFLKKNVWKINESLNHTEPSQNPREPRLLSFISQQEFYFYFRTFLHLCQCSFHASACKAQKQCVVSPTSDHAGCVCFGALSRWAQAFH